MIIFYYDNNKCGKKNVHKGAVGITNLIVFISGEERATFKKLHYGGVDC